MNRLLIAYDDFSENHLDHIRQAALDRMDVVRISQATSEVAYRAALRTAEIVVGWPRAEWLAGTPVRWVQSGSSGWNEYENKGLEALGIRLTTGKGIYSVGVAEHAVAMMLALVRRIPTCVHDKDARLFQRHVPYAAEITGATACIVGMGDIGNELAMRCKGLGMNVIGIVRNPRLRSEFVDEIQLIGSLKTAISRTDHLFLTLPGSAENAGLFSRDVLAAMKPTTYFYNLSRGWTVEEAALYEALRDGRLAGAGLDVTTEEPLPDSSPLWTLGDNVLITGHSAGLSRGFAERFCQLVIGNLHAYFSGKPLQNQVL